MSGTQTAQGQQNGGVDYGLVKEMASGIVKEVFAELGEKGLFDKQQNGQRSAQQQPRFGLQKDVADAHTGTLLHGPGGMFSTEGLESALISLHVKTRGVGQLLPAFPTTFTDPRFGFLTGVSDDVGSEPYNPCDPAPTGYIKSGTLSAKFGRVSRDTETIRLPEVIERLHRGDFTDLMLVNSVLNEDFQGVQYPNDISEAEMLNMVTVAEQVNVGVRMERKLGELIWQGNIANKTGGGGYQEFPGLDAQIATGQVDSETNDTMPAADSLVLNWGHNEIGVADIVEPISEAEDVIYDLAEATGVDVAGVIVMRPQAWRALSAVWPVQYNSEPYAQSLADDTGARYIIDGRTMVDQRDQMRNGLWIPINGRRYNVVLDTGIVEEDHSTDATNLDADEFASSIYFLPLVMSGLPVTYWQFKDYSVFAPQTAMLRGMETWYTDGGRFLWSYDGKYTCFTLKSEVEPRVVLRTPHLAWKLQNVKYRRTWATQRSPDPGNSYWRDGGVSSPERNLSPTNYAVWR